MSTFIQSNEILRHRLRHHILTRNITEVERVPLKIK